MMMFHLDLNICWSLKDSDLDKNIFLWKLFLEKWHPKQLMLGSCDHLKMNQEMLAVIENSGESLFWKEVKQLTQVCSGSKIVYRIPIIWWWNFYFKTSLKKILKGRQPLAAVRNYTRVSSRVGLDELPHGLSSLGTEWTQREDGCDQGHVYKSPQIVVYGSLHKNCQLACGQQSYSSSLSGVLNYVVSWSLTEWAWENRKGNLAPDHHSFPSG